MAAVTTPPLVGTPEYQGVGLATPLSPRFNEGIFVPGRFNSEIIEARQVKPTTQYYEGQITTEEITMSDGSVHEVKNGHPANQQTEVAVIATTALFTRIRGLNKRMMLNLMTHGLPVTFVSAERQFDELELARSAHNLLQIADYEAETRGYHRTAFSYSGISRAAMVGMGVVAMAPAHGKTVVYGDMIVPCYPQKIDLLKPFEYAQQPFREVVTLLRSLGELPIKHLLRYPKTVDLSHAGIHSALRSIPTLVSGQAGEMAAYIDKKTPMFIQTFKEDFMSQGHKWVELFSDHPHAVVDAGEHGGHSGCASQDTFAGWLQRFVNLADELVRVQDNPIEVDHARVHLPPTS